MKLSIITINYNSAGDLERTIKSVVEQSWSEYEFIIIDGGSSDESINIINRYINRINYYVSEPDKGIFNAMNKGIKKASGEYLLMLNAGDILHNKHILNEVFRKQSYTEDILYGNAILESRGKIIGKKNFSFQITFDFFRKTSLSHQSAFIRKQIHSQIGLYDESLKFSADWKFFILAFCKFNVSTRFLDCFIAQCNCDGLTWQPSNFPLMKKENESVLMNYFADFMADYNNYDKLRDKASVLIKVKYRLKERIKLYLNR